MTKRYYCTYFDKNYLIRGLSLICSMNRHENNFTIFVICLDKLTHAMMKKIDLQNVVLVPLNELEHSDAALSKARHNRSVVEYYWTLTPSIILFLMKRNNLKQLTYLDSDLFFFSSPDPIFQEFGDNSILIHGHRFSEKKKHLEIHGIYNVGLLVFKNDENGIACLNWWRDRCNEWCYARVEDGKYADQLYLNHFPTRFNKVHILQHLGAGLAPWNHEQYRVTKGALSGDIFVDGYPLIFYHFHALKFYHPNIIFPLIGTNYDFPKKILEFCYLQYLNALNDSIAMILKTAADYKYGLYDTTFYDAPFVTTRNKHAAVIEIMQKNKRSESWYPLDSNWNCYNTHLLDDTTPNKRPVNRKPFLPRLSIVTPSYNQAKYLEPCIESVLSQGYPNLEYVIMDGGSTDGSLEIIKKYERHLAFWQSCPDCGQYAAINEGFSRCSGDIMSWINSDDCLQPDALLRVGAIFSQNPHIEWITGRPNGIDVNGNQTWVMPMLPIWDRRRFLNKNYKNPFLQQEGTFWRRSLWKRAGAYLATHLDMAGDLELWLRFFRHARLYSVDCLLAAFRKHEGQKTRTGLDRYCQEAEKILNLEINRYALEKSSLHPAPIPISGDQIECFMAASASAVEDSKSRPVWRVCQNDDMQPNESTNGCMISAIVSTYNAEAYIRGCLEDLLAQTISDKMEIIVVDSASSQKEGDIVRSFQKRFHNIKYIRTDKRESVYAAWNRGIKLAKGKYITNANTDDRHRRDALEQMVKVLEANPNKDLAYADVLITQTPNETFDRCMPTGVLRWHDWDRQALLEKGCFIGPQPVWRRCVHDTYGLFSERYSICGDYEFWARISQTCSFVHIETPLGLYLDRPDSVEHAHHEQKLLEEREISAIYKDAAANGKVINKESHGRKPDTLHVHEGSISKMENLKGHKKYDKISMAKFAQGGMIMYSPESILNTIRQLVGGEHSNEACWFLDKLIAEYPDMAAAHSERAQIAYEQDDMGRAQKHYELAAELAPGTFEFQKNLGDYRYAVQQDGKRALSIYQKALALEPNNVEVLTLAGHLSVSLHRFDQARQYYSRAVSNAPDDMQLRQYLDKLNTMPSAVQPEQKTDGDLYAIALEKAENGDRQGALSTLKALIDRDAGNALAHNDIGILYYEAGENDNALAHYQEAVRLSPQNSTFQKNLGDLCWFVYGNAQAAMTRYMEALKLEPQDVEALLACGQICMSIGRYGDAREFLDCVLTIEPWNEEARQMINRIETADSNENDGLDRGPVNPIGEPQNDLTTQNIHASIDDMLQTITESPQDARAFNDLGVLYFESGDKGRALHCYERAVSLQPRDAVFVKNLADFYLMEQGRIEDALKMYVSVLEDNPQDVDCLISTGLICRISGKTDDACDFYQRALEIEPWNQSAREALNELTQNTDEILGQTGFSQVTA